MRLVCIALSLCVALILGGCAHPISLQADLAKLAGTGPSPKIDRKVALQVSDAQRALQLTSAGGGGDQVSYSPYKDLETGLYLVLSESFTQVSRVSSLSDPRLAQDGVTLVFVPEISATSYSPSIVTWPPTIFTLTVDGRFVTPANATVASVRVQGEGRAEYDEFKTDFSITSKRAAQDTLRKLMEAIKAAADKLR